jgi:hypothetical protein
VPTVFFAFRDAPERRAALRAPESLDRYRLFGLDEVERRGIVVRHNLERAGRPPFWARVLDRTINAALHRAGGYGGDFASVLASLRAANACDVVFSTVDTVGIPLMLLKRARVLRPPLVYTAVGLPERLVQLRTGFARRLYAAALRQTHAIVAYSAGEADWLRNWVGADGPPAVFVPFGVDTASLNVGELERFAVGANVDEKALRGAKLVRGQHDRIKILGDGELSKKLTVTAHAFSKSAIQKIEKAGGKAILLAPPVAES